MSVNYQVSVAFHCMMVCFTCNPGQKVWDTLGDVNQVNPLLPPPAGQCWMLKGKIPFTHLAQVTDLNFDRGEMAKKPKFNTYIYCIYSLPLTFEDYWLGWSGKQNKTKQ